MIRKNQMRQYLLHFLKTILTFHSWRVIKIIGQSYLSTATIVVPFFGYLILFSAYSTYIFSTPIGNILEFSVQTDPPYSFLNVKYTYIGLSLVGFATIFFRLLCPPEISNYRDPRDYINNSLDTMHHYSAQELALRAKQPYWYDFCIPFKKDAAGVAIDNHRRRTITREQSDGGTQLMWEDWLERNRIALNTLLELNYNISNYSLILFRTIIIVLYAMGFTFTLIPSIKIFIPVLQQIISSIQMGHF